MYKIILLLLVLPKLVFAQKAEYNCSGNTYIDKGIYQICYAQKFKQPLVASYYLYKPVALTKSMSKQIKSSDFYTEKDLTTVSDKDFEKLDYDKGHLVPAEDFADLDFRLKITFSYVNCALQNHKLNKGKWHELEVQVRQWAQTDSLSITIECIFNDPYKRTLSGIAIPCRFRKTILFMSSEEKFVYELPNEDCLEPLEFYRIE